MQERDDSLGLDNFGGLLGCAWRETDAESADRATLILTTPDGRGLTMRAQMGTSRKTLLSDAEEAADLVLLPRRGNAAQDF